MKQQSTALHSSNRRRAPRLKLRCRARIRIGERHYAGYVEDISTDGARIRTFTPIAGVGPVCVTVPDLPPLRGHIRWMEPQGGGVCFNMTVCDSVFTEWAKGRLGSINSATADPVRLSS